MSDVSHTNRNFIVILLCAGLLILLAVMQFRSPPAVETENYGFSEGSARLGDQIIAKVNSTPIYLSDVQKEALLQGIVKTEAELNENHPQFEAIVQTLIQQRLLALAALQQSMDQNHETRQRLAHARERILSHAFIDAHMADTVTEDALRTLYVTQKRLSGSKMEVKARHIVVKTEENAKNIVARLNQGEAFTALAAAYSLDRATRDNAGVLGYFTDDMLNPTLTEVAFSTNIDEQADIFQTEAGWHVLEVLDKREKAVEPYEEIKNKLQTFLVNEEMHNLMMELQNKADIQIQGRDDTQDHDP